MSSNNIAASGQAVPAGSGRLRRIIVCTHSSGTIQLKDSPGGDSGREMLPTYTLPSGAQILEVDLDYSTGVHVNIGGTASLVFVYDPTKN